MVLVWFFYDGCMLYANAPLAVRGRRAIAPPASRRTEHETLASLGSHQANVPIIPILSILKGLSVVRIEVLLLPVASLVRLPDPTPSLQPHYELSSLMRVGPPQCSASVRWPRGFRRLGFSLSIRAN